MRTVLAFDLGASSGRLVANHFDGRIITSEEIHRFSNKPVHIGSHFYWDDQFIIRQMKQALEQAPSNACTVGIDTWGVDFGLLGKNNQLLAQPFSYRDPHTEVMVNTLQQHMTPFELFQRTGNEVASINTLFQLMAIQEDQPQLLKEVTEILLLPNLFSYYLTGIKNNEFTIASTTQLMNPSTKAWDRALIQDIFGQDLPLCDIVQPHQIIGPLDQFPTLQMVAVPGHDTASALSALPIEESEALFMSLGTWGLVGKEVQEPIVSIEAFNGGFTNEGTSEGTYRFQKNAMGFWLLHRLREEWQQQQITLSYEDEKRLFYENENFSTFIDPNDESFFNPANMQQAIQHYCRMTNQQAPETVGQYIRCITLSLALSYATIAEQIEQMTANEKGTIYIGGGGAENEQLCQMLANISGKQISAGPTEASSLGNGLSQLRALGEIHSLQEGRDIIKASYLVKRYEPQVMEQKELYLEKFRQLFRPYKHS
ncbi:rhamnulokinase family protein [Lysinibacillus sp. NPDC096418]|uniref:rhamnulokinase n=1 Tax=Lysinibacillus sp. NPDC096418 TaxID=3364138 RepID=UPI0037F44483